MVDFRRLDVNWPAVGMIVVFVAAAAALTVAVFNRTPPDRAAGQAAVAEMDRASTAFKARHAESRAASAGMDLGPEVPPTEADAPDAGPVSAPLIEEEDAPLDLDEPVASEPL